MSFNPEGDIRSLRPSQRESKRQKTKQNEQLRFSPEEHAQNKQIIEDLLNGIYENQVEQNPRVSRHPPKLYLDTNLVPIASSRPWYPDIISPHGRADPPMLYMDTNLVPIASSRPWHPDIISPHGRTDPPMLYMDTNPVPIASSRPWFPTIPSPVSSLSPKYMW